ncbi:unnamed protein product [Rangifer tarandus platyrhynchus]|uniref:Uncharacterized protein n=1 Tax=Rangifer tarandus platyrhynchus TaxID=3082113 RepID=A0ABN8ZYM6_RANTA|nr:unnamed protein product [Rangifer tarandus platyrhynchus]
MSMPGRTSRDQRTGFVAQTERELGRRGDTASRLGSDGREEQDWAEAGAPVGGNFTEQWAVGEDPCLLIQEEDMGQSPSQAVREGGACGYQGAWKDPDLPMMMAKLAGSHLYPPDLGPRAQTPAPREEPGSGLQRLRTDTKATLDAQAPGQGKSAGSGALPGESAPVTPPTKSRPPDVSGPPLCRATVWGGSDAPSSGPARAAGNLSGLRPSFPAPARTPPAQAPSSPAGPPAPGARPRAAPHTHPGRRLLPANRSAPARAGLREAKRTGWGGVAGASPPRSFPGSGPGAERVCMDKTPHFVDEDPETLQQLMAELVYSPPWDSMLLLSENEFHAFISG